PDTMAATVATPLERALGRIAGITEMTSSSSLGSTRITLQFDLDRNIDGAAPIMIMALTSNTMTQGQMYDAASTIVAQKLSQVQGIGQVTVGGSSLPA